MLPPTHSDAESGMPVFPRRSVVAAGAWSVPVIAAATAAPAYAASPCSQTYGYKLRWGTTPYTHDQAASSDTSLTTGGGFATVTPLTVGGATIYVVLSSARSGNTTFDSNRNLSVPTTGGTDNFRDPAITSLGGLNTTTGENVADSPQRGLRLQNWRSGPTDRQVVSTRANRQTLTVTFRTGSRTGVLRPVKNLSFWITDIDSLAATGSGTKQDPYADTNTRYYDRVELSPAGFGQARDQAITGLGTVASPWRNTNLNNNQGENLPGARVKVTFPFEISTFTIDYWNAVGGAQYHRIFLSNLKFDVFGC